MRVISESPTDVQPVFEAIVDSGRSHLLNCALATVLRTDGQTLPASGGGAARQHAHEAHQAAASVDPTTHFRPG